jgi:lipase
VLGIHGVTASSLALAPVARHLAPRATLLAPDLRGRGGSAGLPGPYGMRAHAADVARVIEAAGVGPVVVVGESMGAFVAVVLAAERPDLVERLVLVDGGLPLPLPDGVEPDEAIRATLGPALARLSLWFPDHQAYLDFWRVHPAFAEAWNDDVEAYLRYDLAGSEPRLRSRVAEAAVRADAPEVLASSAVVASALDELRVPVHLLRAVRNLQNLLPPLVGDALVEYWRKRVPQLTDEVVPGTNHYSIMFGEPGAATVAARTLG